MLIHILPLCNILLIYSWVKKRTERLQSTFISYEKETKKDFYLKVVF